MVRMYCGFRSRGRAGAPRRADGDAPLSYVTSTLFVMRLSCPTRSPCAFDHRRRVTLAVLVLAWCATPLAKVLHAQDGPAVEFLAHPGASPSNRSLSAHAWICLVHKDGGRECVGFGPKSAGAAALGVFDASDRPGHVTGGELGGAGRSASVLATGSLSAAQLSAARAVAAQWRRRGYNLLWSNCTDLLEAVALSVGLETPPGNGPRIPVPFVRALVRANAGRLSMAREP